MKGSMKRVAALILSMVLILSAAIGPLPVGAVILPDSVSGNEISHSEAVDAGNTLSGNIIGELGTNETEPEETEPGDIDQKVDTVSGNHISEDDVVVLTKLYEDMIITLAGTTDILPEDAEVMIAPLSVDDLAAYMATIRSQELKAGAKGVDFKFAIDISVVEGNGEEIHLDDTVTVTIENSVNTDDLAGNDAFEVYHVTNTEKAETEKMDTTTEGDALIFETDSFSPYIGTVTTYSENDNYAADKPYLKSNGASGSQYFSYTGQVVEWTAPQDGRYSLEAIGGGNAGADGSEVNRQTAMDRESAYGGYSIAYVNLNKGDKIYVAVGGAGSKSTSYKTSKGGWNGGGAGYYMAGSGGGATTFASKLIGDGTLVNYKDNKSDLIVVAGGAGGLGSLGVFNDMKYRMSVGGGGNTTNNVLDYDGNVVTNGASASNCYAFGKGQGAIKSVTVKGVVLAGGAGGGGVYGGFASSYYGLTSDLNSNEEFFGTYGGTGGTGYINTDESSEVYALNGSFTQSAWFNGDTKDSVFGNGQAAINYLGSIQSTVTLNLGNYATYNGKNGYVEVAGTQGTTLDLSSVKVTNSQSHIIGWNIQSGDGMIATKSQVFTFGKEDTVLVPLIYDNIDLVTTQQVGAAEFGSYKYNNNILVQWDESGNNNSKTYSAYQSVDGGAWREITFSEYTTLTPYPSTYHYTGNSQTYIAPYDGKYVIELYGGQGGQDGGTAGGYGGYLKGAVTLKAGDKVTINVGGGGVGSYGDSPHVIPGGWNGGGSAVWSGGGGGRTDIYVNGTLVAAAAGGGGATNGKGAYNARLSTQDLANYVSTWQGESLTYIDPDENIDNYEDAGGGGAGYRYGGNAGIFEDKPGGHGGYGGYNGYNSTFTLISESTGPSGESQAAYSGGQHGKAIITPQINIPVYKDLSSLQITPDLAVPNKPYGGSVSYFDAATGKANITWKAPNDNGTVYRHKVTATAITSSGTLGNALGESNIALDRILSGVAGYYYYSDDNQTGIVTKNHMYTESTSVENITVSGDTTYLHVAAVDRAGNLGATYDIPINGYYFKTGSVSWVDNDNEYGLRPGSDIIYLYKDGVLVDQTTVTTENGRAEFTFTNLEYGHTYTVSQQSVVPYGVSQSDWDFVNTLLMYIHKNVYDEDGKDIDGDFVNTDQTLRYEITVGQDSDGDTPITVFDQIPVEVDFVSADEGVTVIQTAADLEAYNRLAQENGYEQVPEKFADLTSPVLAYYVTGTKGGVESFSYHVKVKDSAETKHIFNTASGLFHVDDINKKAVEIISNEVENIVRFNPVKTVTTAENIDVDKTAVTPGDVLTYTIEVMNVAATQQTARITDVLPVGVKFLTADHGGSYNEATKTVSWIIPVAAGAKATVSCEVEVLASCKDEYVTNTVDVELNGPNNPPKDPPTVYIMGDPEKEVYDEAGREINGAVVYEGEVITYMISYTNDSDETRKFTVTDTMPDNVEIVEIDNGGQLQADEKTIVWEKELGAGEELRVTVDVKPLASAKDTVLKNKATLKLLAPDDPDAEYEKETNEVENPVMPDPVKTVTSENGQDINGFVVEAGSVLRYTISFENPADISRVFTITDAIPEGLAFMSADHDGIYDKETRTVTFTYDAAAGSENEVSFLVKVLQEEGYRSLPNAAIVVTDAGESESNAVFNETIVKPIKSITDGSGKDINGHTVYWNKEILYAITYTNYTDTARDIMITDQVNGWLRDIREVSDGGVYQDNTITWTLKQVPAKTTRTVTFKATTPAPAYNIDIPNQATITLYGNDLQYIMEDGTAGTGEMTFESNVVTIHIPPRPITEKTAYGAVEILKVNEAGEPLAGAILQLLDSKGHVVDEWISDTESRLMEHLENDTYTLHEVSAPEGYEIAEDIEVDVNNESGTVQITMVDKKADKTAVTGLVPHTGDEMRPAMALALCVIAGAAGLSMVRIKRKKDDE